MRLHDPDERDGGESACCPTCGAAIGRARRPVHGLAHGLGHGPVDDATPRPTGPTIPGPVRHAGRISAAAALAFVLAAAATAADAPQATPRRFRAPVEVVQAADIVQLTLPASAYARSLQPGLRDLRLVDAAGEPVPFARLDARDDAARSVRQARAIALYRLPEAPAAGDRWQAPIELTVRGDRVEVRPRSTAPATPGATAGWLFDLGDPGEPGSAGEQGNTREPQRAGERSIPGNPAERRGIGTSTPRDTTAIELQWSAPDEFSAAYTIETSDDLRQWRAAGSGELMELAAPVGAMAQRALALPPAPGRFVRLWWSGDGPRPALTSALAVSALRRAEPLDPPETISIAPLGAGGSTGAIDTTGANSQGSGPGNGTLAGTEPGTGSAGATDAASRRALVFDLGGRLPLRALRLELPPEIRVAPVRIDARDTPDGAWRALAATVFVRGTPERPAPALVLRGDPRQLRITPDERTPALDPLRTRLLADVAPARLVFTPQGRPPYTLQAGSAGVADAALPIGTLVPDLERERPRFGRATLGAWSEDADAALAADAAARRARWHPWVLWAVLLAGVAALGAMVWRLARGSAGPEKG